MKSRPESGFALASLCARGDAEGLRSLLFSGAALNAADLSRALLLAARKGRSECVALLIPLADPMAGESEALRLAAMRGHAKCVSILIPHSNPKAMDSQALCWAFKGRHIECIELLTPVSDPLSMRFFATSSAQEHGPLSCGQLSPAAYSRFLSLCSSSRLGDSKMVELLIPIGSPEHEGSRPLRLAAKHDRAECAKLLLPASAPVLSNPEPLFEALRSRSGAVVAEMLAREPELLSFPRFQELCSTAFLNAPASARASLSSAIERASIAQSLLPQPSPSLPCLSRL